MLKDTDFKMKILKSFRSPLERQIWESLEIERRGWTADTLLNKKEEFNKLRMPRLRLESVESVSEKDIDDEESREQVQEMKARMRKEWSVNSSVKRKSEIDSDSDNKDEETGQKKKKRRISGGDIQCHRGGNNKVLLVLDSTETGIDIHQIQMRKIFFCF